MKGLDDKSIMDMNMSDGYSHIVLNADVGNNESMQGVFQRHNC